jgi:sigma-B regulation protein RsbU (phosphoserine phosphatase)
MRRRADAMLIAPLPSDETERLADLRALEWIDTPAEERFDRIVGLASRALEVPIAFVSLVDSDEQYLKAKCGLTLDRTGRETSFCGHAILADEPMVVPDALQDERFVDNPLVTGEPYIRFYAGHPLKGPDGHNVGTFCIADTAPREPDQAQMEVFRKIAAIAERELNMVDLIAAQRQLIQTKSELARTRQHLAHEMEEAKHYVCSTLPAPLVDGPVQTQWTFRPSSQLGGDALGYHWLDERRFAVYLLDVLGHGVGAALLSVSVHQTLRRHALPGVAFDQPNEVLAALNDTFPMGEHHDRFFTIWYGVYDTHTRVLRAASGGHPPAIAVTDVGPVRMGRSNLIVGVASGEAFETDERSMPPGSLLYLFSDGAYEVPRPEGGVVTIDGLEAILQDAIRNENADTRLHEVVDRLQAIQRCEAFDDDLSLLELAFS